MKIKLSTGILCLVILLGIVVYDSRDNGDNGQYLLYATIDEQRINAFQYEGEQYIFLPGYADEENLILSSALEDTDDVTVLKSSGIASVFITTSSGKLDKVYESQDNRESGRITVYEADGTINYSGKLKYIKGRGNYGWNNWDKKPFGISFGSKTSLLGLGSGYKYALIANASDATLIRNDVARDMEAAIGLKHSHVGRFVDLYINGDYMGNYYLIDTLEIGDERIDIFDLENEMLSQLRGTAPDEFPIYETPLIKGWNLPELTKDNTGGYLIEREFADRYTVDYAKNPSCFTTDYDEHFLVKSPECCSKEQINYICDYVSELEGAIRSYDGINPKTGRSYIDYIDLESMTKKYVVEEFTKNYDAGVSSAYFYKDIDTTDNKLHAAPGWDYDMCLGNYLEWMDFGKTGARGYIHNTNNTDASVWWERLFDKPEFSKESVAIYKNMLRPYLLNEGIDRIDYLEDTLSDSAGMDYLRWKDMYDSLGYYPGDTNEYEKLKKFILERIEFLDGE